MNDLDTFAKRAAQRGQSQVTALKCTIATTASSADDEVFVTIDSDRAPRTRQPVEWRPRISDSGTLTRVYPVRNMRGTIIPTDIGKAWLLW